MRKRQRINHRNTPSGSRSYLLLFGAIIGVFLLTLIVLIGRYVIKNYLVEDPLLVNPVVSAAQSVTYQDILDETDLPVSKTSYLDGGNVFLLEIENGPNVYLPSSGDKRVQMTVVQDIIQKLEIENKKASVIDLRFSKPIVKF